MASDECGYYYYDSGYSCALKREKEGNSSIDHDTVKRYCWGYHYEECPRYKDRNGSGGCFLTSACVEAKGLPDDCYELTTLRKFRDEYLAKLDCGKCEIAHYYQVAPAIVAKIKAMPNALEVFEGIYDELVLPCVRMIDAKNYTGAHKRYRDYVLKLENTEDNRYGPVYESKSRTRTDCLTEHDGFRVTKYVSKYYNQQPRCDMDDSRSVWR